MYYYQNYSSALPSPTASLTVNRACLDHHDGDTFYLKDETQFEIELFNPRKSKVLAKIEIDGTSVSGNGIVLHPGEKVLLERRIDSSKKFLFKTYRAGDSKEADGAISENGRIRVSFYEEQVSFSLNNATNNFPSFLLTDSPTWKNDGLPYAGTTINYITTTAGANASVAGSLETGRVEKGKLSDQVLSTEGSSFCLYATNVVDLKILPESQKPENSRAIRNYCSNCGTNIKGQGWKFCPSCGTQV